jgi:hypothetical protein
MSLYFQERFSIVETKPAGTILGLSMVKNEQDVIEPFVRHNIRLLDRLVVLDNGSVDGTRTILAKLSEEFSNLVVIEDERFGYTQSEIMTSLLHKYQPAFAADYVLPLDADEFVGAADRAALLRELQQIPQGGSGLVSWATFVLTPEVLDIGTADPLPRMVFRRRQEQGPLPFRKCFLRVDGAKGVPSKPGVPDAPGFGALGWKPGVPDAPGFGALGWKPDFGLLGWNVCDLKIDQGNHSISSYSGRTLPVVDLSGLRLLHFPLRSREQFVAKTVVGWMAYLAKNPQAARADQGLHWLANYRLVTQEGALATQALCDSSLMYAQLPRTVDWSTEVVQEPPQLKYKRRYSDGSFPGALQLVARSWEHSLTLANPAFARGGTAPRQTSAPPHHARVGLGGDPPDNSPETAAGLVVRLLEKGKLPEALSLLTAALAAEETAERWNDWATLQYRCGDLAAAQRGYRRALELDRSHRQAAVNLGLLLFAGGQMEQGLQLLEAHKDTLTPPERQAILELAKRSETRFVPPEQPSHLLQPQSASDD